MKFDHDANQHLHIFAEEFLSKKVFHEERRHHHRRRLRFDWVKTLLIGGIVLCIIVVFTVLAMLQYPGVGT